MPRSAYALLLPLFALTLLLPLSSASANPPDEPGAETSPLTRTSVGLRVGGYGFRHVRDDQVHWDGCRMDGTGLFATFDLTDHLFAELGLDMYHAIGRVVANGMERLSLFQTAALGLRSHPIWIFTPYLQAGLGAEWTRIEVDPRSHTAWLPLGFIGLGAEATLGNFSFGATLRSALMGDADHTHDHYDQDHHLHHTPDDPITIRFEPAGHALFFARFRL